MFVQIFFCLSLSICWTSAQFPNSYQSGSSSPNGNWQRASPSAGIPSPTAYRQQYQPYRGSSISSTPQNLGQYQTSPQLSTLSQLSAYGYNRVPQSTPQNTPQSTPQSSPWSQYQPLGSRGWSAPSPVSSYPGYSQPASSGVAEYSRPTPLARPSIPQAQQNPFQSSWSVNHQGSSSQLTSPQSQAYNVPAPVASPPIQTWQQPSPVTQWRPSPAQTYSAPSPLTSPTSQSWSPPPTVTQWRPSPAQTYSAPQAAPVAANPQPVQQYSQPAPVASVSSYQSPQNSQNLKPAPVHYASIGQQLQGDYKFGYHTGDGGSFREETRLPDGTVQGAYGFIDADGKQRIVKYRAGKDGFQAEGDDVPKGTPAISGEAAQGPSPSQSINIDDGAAFKSFTQG